jgi:hypothetical protein
MECTHSGPVHDIAAQHGLNIHMYTDDTQIYITFDLSQQGAVLKHA